MAVARANPITPQDVPDLEPLRNSNEADQLEADLKALFIQMFDQFVRPGERISNTAGMPHLGPFSQVERAVKAEGLALLRNTDEASMRYIFRAWRARNPKRGLHMLRTYLQLFWPNGFEMYQQWQDPAQVYPANISDTLVDGYFQTSRVKVYINSTTSNGSDVAATAPALRSVVPARVLLDVNLLTRNQIDASMALGMVGCLFHDIDGSFV